MFIDYEGRSEGESVKRILTLVEPRQVVRLVTQCLCSVCYIHTVCMYVAHNVCVCERESDVCMYVLYMVCVL